jgi:hypothetical protein
LHNINPIARLNVVPARRNSYMKKTTITIEERENGKLRITVDGPPFIVNNHNLSSRDITPRTRSDFRPAEGQSRREYSSQYCTADEERHDYKPCEGTCHDLNCDELADFLVHWKGDDRQERCVPFCKWHAESTAELVGETVLMALRYGVTEDLRFWPHLDVLPSGDPRCDHRYKAVDTYGDLEWARCTNAAAVRVTVTPAKTVMANDGSANVTYTPKPEGAYEACACGECYESAKESIGTEGNPANIDIIGELCG